MPSYLQALKKKKRVKLYRVFLNKEKKIKYEFVAKHNRHITTDMASLCLIRTSDLTNKHNSISAIKSVRLLIVFQTINVQRKLCTAWLAVVLDMGRRDKSNCFNVWNKRNVLCVFRMYSYCPISDNNQHGGLLVITTNTEGY